MVNYDHRVVYVRYEWIFLMICNEFSLSVENAQPLSVPRPYDTLVTIPDAEEHQDTFVLMPTPAQRGMAKGQRRNMKCIANRIASEGNI